MFGYGGASAARSQIAPIRWFGKTYMAVVRGVPDIAFFLFFVIALDQGIEYLRQKPCAPIGQSLCGRAMTSSSARRPRCRWAMRRSGSMKPMASV